MRQIIYLFIFIFSFSLLVGCNETDISNAANERVAVEFGMATIALTKVNYAGDSWSQYDSIGIFMMEAGKGIEFTMEGGNNLKFRQYFQASNRCYFFPDMIPIYYPVDGRPVDFISYYPFKRDITDYIYPVDVSSEHQIKPQYIDIVYSDNAKRYNKNSRDSVQLVFRHVLSKLTFTLQEGEGAPDLNGARIKISNLYRKADLTLADGQVTNLDSPGEIEVDLEEKSRNSRDDGSDISFLIVIPQKAENNILTITLPNEEDGQFEWDFPAREFEAGFNYSYTITVHKTGIQVSHGDIIDWNGKDDAPVEAGVGQYKVGDYYPDPQVNLADPAEKAKIQGIVYWLDPADSRHGKIISLEQSIAQWANHGADHGANDRDNGMKNMYDIAQYIKNTNYGWGDFPAFNWIHAKNDSNEDYSHEHAKGVWYLPSESELLELKAVYNSFGKSAFNTRLTDAGGVPLEDNFYWGSTADKTKPTYAFVSQFETDLFAMDLKSSSNKTRCISAF